MAREVGIFLDGQPRRVDVLPEGDVHSLGKPPGRGHAVDVHGIGPVGLGGIGSRAVRRQDQARAGRELEPELAALRPGRPGASRHLPGWSRRGSARGRQVERLVDRAVLKATITVSSPSCRAWTKTSPAAWRIWKVPRRSAGRARRRAISRWNSWSRSVSQRLGLVPGKGAAVGRVVPALHADLVAVIDRRGAGIGHLEDASPAAAPSDRPGPASGTAPCRGCPAG